MNCYRSGCGHTRNAHDHYRANLDCALCGCHWFLARTWWRVLLSPFTDRYTETESAAAGAKH